MKRAQTVSKPLATFIKAQAQNHPKFRSLCIRFAQFTHRHEQMLNVRLIGHQIVSIKPLTEERAIQAGTELFGEIVLFSLAGLSQCIRLLRYTDNFFDGLPL